MSIPFSRNLYSKSFYCLYDSTCRLYVEEQLGRKYVEKASIPFDESYKETGPGTPVFFVLSPGVDPLKDVEQLGKKLGFTIDNKNFHNVSLGQGQEVVAENALDVAAKEGHWVILQVNTANFQEKARLKFVLLLFEIMLIFVFLPLNQNKISNIKRITGSFQLVPSKINVSINL